MSPTESDNILLHATATSLSTHEAVCAERYTQITMRLGRLEGGLTGGGGAIIILLIGVIFSILVKH